MWHTHNYEQEKTVTPAQWRKFRDEVEVIFDHLPPYSLASDSAYADKPILLADGDGSGAITQASDLFHGESCLIFNGRRSQGLNHDQFMLYRKRTTIEKNLPFCRTARKPYDFFVIACLILISERAPGAFEITSDRVTDWAPVGSWLCRTLRRDVRLPDGIHGIDPPKTFSYVLESTAPSFYSDIEVVRRVHPGSDLIIESVLVEDGWF